MALRKRRTFIKLAGAEAAALAMLPRVASGATYKVGVGNSRNGYTATQRAIAASGDFPNVAGRVVVIKPNLVIRYLANTGATTDPEVVRAVVDRALSGGASQVLLIEGGAGEGRPTFFTECGYRFFDGYDPKVRLVDCSTEPYTMLPVVGGLAYRWLYLTAPAVQGDPVFISVAKLKTHVNTYASMAMKNLVALGVPARYSISNMLPRMDMHLRGIDQAVVDINLARPIHYAVVDAVYAMEGDGPALGTPVAMNTVLAGNNAVAVDRACLHVMQFSQTSVAHLAYATTRGLGPADMSSIQLTGDALVPVAFRPPAIAPLVWQPTPRPASFTPAGGQQSCIFFNTPGPCYVRLEILAYNDITPGISFVRLLREWSMHPGGTSYVLWNGRDYNGNIVRAGTYAARIMGRSGEPNGSTRFATNWVTVTS